MLLIDTNQTRAALPFDALIPALRDAFAEGAEVPLRHTHHIESGGADGLSLIMPAWNEQGYYGVKIINIFAGNGRIGLPGLHATYTLFSARTGVPLAHADGDVITAYRTAGAAALGASFLAREDAETLVIVGAGRIASLVAPAMRSVRPIRRVLVWNRRAASAEALAADLSKQGFDAEAVADLEPAVRAADIVSCATLSTTPLIQPGWLQAGAHLDLIGGFTPDMVEAHPDCFRGAEVYADTPEAAQKAGDLLQAFASGALAPDGIRATLVDLCAGRAPGRRDASAITIFKAVGNALEDLTAARLAYQAVSGNSAAAGRTAP